MKKEINLSYLFFTASILALFILYAFLWLSMIIDSNPYTGRTGKDFIIFYTAGRVAEEYGIEHTYSLTLQKHVQEDILGFSIKEPLPYNHIPFFIPLLIAISKIPYAFSFSAWTILLLLLYAESFHLISKKIQNAKLILSGFFFFPIFISILQGQDTALLFLGITLIYLGYIEQETLLAGGGLALTTIRPHIALPLMLFMLFRFKDKKKLLVPSLIFVIISIILLGKDGVHEYLNILRISVNGNWVGFNENDFINFKGILTRYTPILSTFLIQRITWAAYFLNTFFLAIWWSKNKKTTLNHLSISLSLIIFFSPHLYDHDASIIIIPLLFLISTINTTNKETGSLMVSGITFLMIFSKSTAFYYALPSLLIMTIIIFAIKEIDRGNPSKSPNNIY